MALPRLLLAAAATLLFGSSAAVVPPGSGMAALSPAARQAARPAASATPLTLAIDSATAIVPGQPLTLEGIASNTDDVRWLDANVYLAIAKGPARDERGLEADAEAAAAAEADDREFAGTRLVDFELFDQLGTLAAGERRPWQLTIPYGRLPISRAAGVYQIQVTLLAGGRNHRSEKGRVTTVLPLLPPTAPATSRVMTLVALTAPIYRHPDGTFANDDLSGELGPGGRLRHLLDLLGQAPSGTLQVAVDPALWQAAIDMAAGYHVGPYVRPVLGNGPPDPDDIAPAPNGQGRQVAVAWLADLENVSTTQRLAFLPWGNPDTNALSDAAMPGVVEAAIRASRDFATTHGLEPTVVDWQNSGSATRHALDVARGGGATIHVISQQSLPRLDDGSPAQRELPSQVAVTTRHGPLTAIVAPRRFAGAPFSRGLSAFEFRQRLLALATIRALHPRQREIAVVTTPFNWDPGPRAARVSLAPAFDSPVLDAVGFAELDDEVATSYVGPVTEYSPTPEMSSTLLDLTRHLRGTGRTYTQLLSDSGAAAKVFERQLAIAGSATWRWHPHRGEVFVRRATSAMARRIALVTVSGPAFVAMSSSTGRFPLTVSNELDVPVTVQLDVEARNPALRISEVAAFQLAAGQRRDVDVRTRAEGSGVTSVEATLSTTTSRRFGEAWQFDVRATQIGLAIWVVIGVAGSVLLIAVVRRLVARWRASEFRPRGELRQ